MSQSVTLTELRALVREAADMEGSSFVDDTELDKKINNGVKYLWRELARYFPDDYLTSTTPSPFVTVANVQTVSLPTDFMKLVGVDFERDGVMVPAKGRFPFGDRNLNGRYSSWVWSGDCVIVRYKVMGQKLFFQDAPNAVYNGQIWYIPHATALASGSDSVELFGYEQIAVLKAAIACLNKEESDISGLMAELQLEQKNLIETAPKRDIGEPGKTRDVRRTGWVY